MKVSVSLSEDDIAFLDVYAREQGIESRSGALQRAIGALRTSQLEVAYEQAFLESYESGEDDAWDVVSGDGLDAE